MQAPLYKSPHDIPVGTVLGMSFPQGPLNPMDFMGQEFGFDQQPLQQPMMGAMDQGYGGDMGNQSRYDENGFRRSDGRRKTRGFSNPAARPTTQGTMPFGGFRAKGGPVSPGRKYVVGERGAEMFVPDRPGTIVPINPLDRHVNRLNARGDKQLADNADHYSGLEKDYADMAKDYQGMMLSYQETRGQHKPGTPEYEAANKSQNEMYDQFVDKVGTQEGFARDAAKNRGLIGTGQGWKDHVTTDAWSQRRAEAAMAAMRERSMATPGSPRFTGPMMPPAGGGQPQMPQPPSTRLQQAQQQNAIAGQNQRELAAKFNPPVPQGMPMMPADPRRSGPLSGRGQFGAQSGPLSMRGPMPVGRSANDPNRIAEQMRRRGDPRAIMQLGMQQQGMDFARERDATNFQQGLMMNGMQQAAMAQRDATNFQQGLTMFDAQQQAMGQRDERNFQQTQQMEMNRRAYEAQQSAQEAQQRQQFGLKPLQVSGTDTPYFQDFKGSIYTGAAPRQPDAPLSWNPVPNTNGLMMPSGKGSDRLPVMQQQTLNPGWSVTGQPERTRMVPLEKSNTGKSIVPTVKEFKSPDGVSTEYREYNPDTGKWRKVQFEDANGDGIPDAQQTAAPGAAVPAAAPRKTASGITFSRVQ